MLTLTSRFVLQGLPYLLMALAAVVLLPGVADSLIAAAGANATSSPRQIETTIDPFARGETTLDLIRQDHAALQRTFAAVTSPKPPKPILRTANARSCACPHTTGCRICLPRPFGGIWFGR